MAPWAFVLIAVGATVGAIFLAYASFGRRVFVAALMLVLAVTAFAQFDTLGIPKPVETEWRDPQAAEVVWSGGASGGVVAVLSMPDGPRCYFYEGSQAKRQFRKAGIDHEGRRYLLNRPFSRTDSYEFEGMLRELPEK